MLGWAWAIWCNFSWLEHWLDTLLDPGVVPYPELGRLATLHLLPSAFLMFTNANWDGETFGESSGETVVLGE